MEHQLLATADSNVPFRFVVSREGVNRKGFSIDQSGWSLADFRKNPIALWMHNADIPIGTWTDLKIEGGAFSATLKLAARGTSQFIDQLWSFMEQGILKAASVGFRAIDSFYDEKKDKLTITKAELREISLVTVPGDAGALRMMETLSDAQMRDSMAHLKIKPGGSAGSQPPKRNNGMATLADRIKALTETTVTLQDTIAELSAKEDLTDDDTGTLETLSGELETAQSRLASLRKAEAALALGAKSTKPGGGTVHAQPKKGRDKAELIFRSAFVIAKAHVTNRAINEIVLNDFGGDRELDIITLAASNPAMTNVAGWAAELIETQIGEFLDLLSPLSVWAALTGMRVTFDRMGAVRLPGRTARALGGAFVGEGAPIPVKQAALTSILVTPFKLGVITTMTRELAQRSAPAAEPLFRDMMLEDTAVNIDNALMDNTAASALRPAGLQIMGSGSASAGPSVAQIVADLRDMVDDMITAGAGRRPVWVMNESRRIGLLAKLSTTEDSRPFANEVAQGRLFGYPIIASINVPSAIVFLIDQGEFVQGYGDSPAIDMSNQATLHMEDTTPLPIATGAQGSGVLATPTRSLFQTDSLALRLIWDISWAIRRAGAIQFKTGVAW
jgi:HK97 family phage major capsid protein/HK97 family phage prohead protease